MKIYKASVRPIITYAVEARADTTRTDQLLKSTEMKTLRSKLGLTPWDKIRSENIREECEIEAIVERTKAPGRWSQRGRSNQNYPGWKASAKRP